MAVWLTDGRPARIVWEGRRYRVNDTPTRLGDTYGIPWPSFITHLPKPWVGWRFQAVDSSGDARMFEVRRVAETGDWELIRVYT